MDANTFIFVQIIFLFGFTMHNVEEALWLPKWSKNAKYFHPEVESNVYAFAMMMTIILGIIITLLEIIYGKNNLFFQYMYLGLIGLMVVNAVAPHLIAAIVLKKYAPGLATGILLNLPIGIILIIYKLNAGLKFELILISVSVFAIFFLFIILFGFKAIKKIIDF